MPIFDDFSSQFLLYQYIIIPNCAQYLTVNQRYTVWMHSKFPWNGLPFSAVKFSLTYTGRFNSCAIVAVASLQESVAMAYFVLLHLLFRPGEEAISLRWTAAFTLVEQLLHWGEISNGAEWRYDRNGFLLHTQQGSVAEANSILSCQVWTMIPTSSREAVRGWLYILSAGIPECEHPKNECVLPPAYQLRGIWETFTQEVISNVHVTVTERFCALCISLC